MITYNSYKNICDAVYIPNTPLTYTEGQSIYVKTDYIVQFFNENFQIPYILYTASSDYSPSTFFNPSQLKTLLDQPQLIEWRSTNVCFLHPKLKHLSIGFRDDLPERLEFYKNHEQKLKLVEKRDEVYTNFTLDTNPHERSCFPSEKTPVDFETYMYTMASYKYVLCPMGNGLDTHRFWEAQLCGCIPIIRCPKEFLPTYENYSYICLPGWCYARLGHPAIVLKLESIFKINDRLIDSHGSR